MSWKGCDHLLTLELNPGNQRLLTHSPVLETFALHSHSENCLQGHGLESAVCCWDHLDGIGDWIPLRFPPKLFRIPTGRCGDLLILQPPKTRLILSSAYQTCHQPVWSGLPLSSVSPCPVCMGDGLWANSRWASQEDQGIGQGEETCLEKDVSIDLCIGRGGLYVRCLKTALWV